MPVYNLQAILKSDTDATGNGDFVNGGWALTGGWSTITYSDEDTLGLGDNNTLTETGAPAVITAVDGSTTHPLVGQPIFAKFVRADAGDNNSGTDPAVVYLGDGNNSASSGPNYAYGVAQYPGSTWTMNTGDNFVSNNSHTHSNPQNVPGSWNLEGFLGGTTPTMPCFTRGMEIRTDRGPVAVEDLQAGDMIWTLDNGYQELKYITHSRHLAQGSLTPVLFKKGAIGNTEDLIVSQKHRFHVGSLPENYTSKLSKYAETLLQAHSFCNGTTIRLYPEIGTVEYFHLMFDNHELLECYGTISESWQPTKKALKRNPEIADELLAIFPEIGSRTLEHPGALVRREVLFTKAPH